MPTLTLGSRLPDRSREQRLDALDKANAVRVNRALLKRNLRAGHTLIADVLTDPYSWLESAKVFDLLLAVPGIGRTKATKIMHRCDIAPSETVGGMSDGQRERLVAEFCQ